MSAHQALTLTGPLDGEYTLAQPLPITAEWRDEYVTVAAPALGLRAMGQSPEDALDDLRAAIADRYRDLAGRDHYSESAAAELAALRQYVSPRQG